MNLDELILRLNQMAVNGGMNCLGCGHEAGCGIHGCAVLKRAAELLSDMQWRRMDVEVPQEDQEVMVIASRKPRARHRPPSVTLSRRRWKARIADRQNRGDASRPGVMHLADRNSGAVS